MKLRNMSNKCDVCTYSNKSNCKKDFLVLHRGNLRTLCIFDDIKELFLIFRSDDGIMVMFFSKNVSVLLKHLQIK